MFLRVKAAEGDHSYKAYCKSRKTEHGYKPIETLHRVSMSVLGDRFSFLDCQFCKLVVETYYVVYWIQALSEG
jgi:hypothetical protein